MPLRVDVCYCGAKRPKEPGRTARRSAGGRGPSIKLALAAAGVVLLAAGAWFTLGRSEPPPAAVPAAAQARPTGVAAKTQTASTAVRPPQPLPEEPGAPPLADMVERVMQGVVLVESPSTGTSGSGFFAAPDLIVTNAHVLAGSKTVAITRRDGGHADAHAVIVSETKDLAFLQIPREAARDVAIPFARSGALRLGQQVVGVGWAQSLAQTSIRVGLVAGIGRDAQHDRVVIQTDAPPNSGDSGGPLVDRFGRVVGVTSGRLEGNAAPGVAIAIDETRQFLDRVPPNTQSQFDQTSAATPSVQPPAAAPAPVSPEPSDVETRRAQGTKQYDQHLTALEAMAGNLDAIWRSYRTQCGITTVPGGQSHEWFTLYDPHSPLHQSAPYCANALGQIEQDARAIGASMAAAEEAARRDGVFAGDLRALRAKHRLDYAGWDR